ncbi:hypothetical protein M7I_2713 [Glarea lozoyensis 74030]|uniref:DUF5672 domain-containing protein n=1 Tax=Glarea lozoyensis (strain ATCC 74030 / MF5533) TaxID=1104152 RepID=H0EJI7_GLAL7|nr:hypothetical protein M7I_2713 [Glarea lozoyensis 74030]
MASSRHYSFAVIAIVLLVYVWALKVSFLSGYLKHASLTKAIPSNNIAVIIEDRPLPTLTPLLLHFSTVLGPSWPIIFYTRSPNPTNSSSFQRAIDDGRIEIRQLPDDITFTDQESVSEFLTSPWIWEQLAPASHVLVFQADSIVCSNSPSKIDDFLQYDFIGAPIATPSNPRNGHGEGFNGGFSLRNRQMMLDVLAAHDWKAEMQTARYGDIALVLPQVEGVARGEPAEFRGGEDVLGRDGVIHAHGTDYIAELDEWLGVKSGC